MIWMDVDTALSEVPVNLVPLTDDTDFKTVEEAVAYNQAGMDLYWHFTTTAGATTVTAVTPTTGGDYDWAHQDHGIYTIEMPASGGASINNDTEGFGYFTGFCTGVLPWRGPTIGFRAAGLNNLMVDSAYSATRGLGGTALPDAVADAAGGLAISDAGGLDLDTKLANTNEVTAARMGALTDWINGGRLDLILDIIAADTTTDIPALIATAQADLDTITGADGVNLLSATQASIDAIEADTNELQGDNVPGLISALDTVVDRVETDTQDLQTQIGTAGAGLTDLGGMSTGMKAEVESEANDALVAQKLDHLVAVADADDAVNDSLIAKLAAVGGDWSTFVGSDDSLQAIRDRGDGAWAGSPPTIMQTTTIATLASQTSWTLTAGSTDNDAYNLAFALVVDQVTGAQQCICDITDYTGATKTITLGSDPGVFTMATGDTVHIIAAAPGTAAPSAAAIRTEMDSNSTQLASIVADTNELQTDDVPGLISALDTVVDRVETDTQDIQTQIGTAGAGLTDLGGMSTAMKGEVNAEADTAISDASLATAAALSTHDGKLDTAQSDLDTITGADGVNLLSATQASIDAIEADTNEMQGDLANGGRLDLIFDSILSMLDDSRAEPGQGAPPVNGDAMTKLDYLYKAWRNKVIQDATTYELYDDAGSTVDQKATISDDGTDFTKGEVGSGP